MRESAVPRHARARLASVVAATVMALPQVANAACELTRLAAGGEHSIAVDATGVTWAWGGNDRGQLGNGSTIDGPIPQRLLDLDPVVDAAAGSAHSLVLMVDGTVVAFGANDSGQLGNGGLDDSTAPVAVSSIGAVIAVTAGDAHSLAVLGDGTSWAWGANASGQLGDDSAIDRSAPVKVIGLGSTIAVAAGRAHSIALHDDGTVSSWGANDRGQLGIGPGPGRRLAGTVPGLAGIVAIAAAGDHTLALRNDGTVHAWGANDAGQLGDGSTIDATTPVVVSALTDAMLIAAGERHSLAATDDAVYAWGDNGRGQLGVDGVATAPAPIAVASIADSETLGAGDGHSLVGVANGFDRAWGDNARGQLGDGTTDDRPTPRALWFFATSPECSCREVVEHLVGYAGPDRNAVRALVDGLPYATVVNDIPTGTAGAIGRGSFLVELTSTAMEAAFVASVISQPGVRFTEKNCPTISWLTCTPATGFPDDPGLRPENNDCKMLDEDYQWAMDRIEMAAGWNLLRYRATVRDVTVAVLDTGTESGHPDLPPTLIGHSLDLVNGYPQPVGDNFVWVDDADGAVDDSSARHGTMVAGVIAAQTNNTLGIAGAACSGCGPSRSLTLLNYKVLDANATGEPAQLALGMHYAVEHGAEVINLSLGTFSDSATVRDACESARDAGAIVVAAAGNWGGDYVLYPAAYGSVLAVGSSDELDHTAEWSNRGVAVDLYAPGTAVLSTATLVAESTTRYAYHAGTSLSAPMVSATLALARAVFPEMVSSELLTCAITDSATPVIDVTHGRGLVNVPAFLAEAMQLMAAGVVPCPPRPPFAPPGFGPPSDIPESDIGGGGLISIEIEPSVLDTPSP